MSKLNSYNCFLKLHNQNQSDGLRLGQRFCNLFIKKSYPRLFFADDKTAEELILRWLNDHQYINKMPPIVRIENETPKMS